jgi:methylglyoxal reductase
VKGEVAMEKRKLGSSDVEVSVIGLGCWAIGGWMWGGTDDEKAVAAIQKAIDIGMVLIDTAPIYGFGHSETIVGKAIQGRRDEVVLATKCGLVWEHTSREPRFTDKDGNPVYGDLTKQSILREVEDSLRRLQTDRIDIYQCHRPDVLTPAEETMEALTLLYKQGKIRTISVSNYSVEQMEEFREFGPVHSDQPRYSMLDRTIEEENLPYCRKNNIGILAYSPIEQGLLTGKVTLDRKFPPSDYRGDRPWFQKENLRRALVFLEKLKPIAADHGKTLAQLAANWVICQEGITAALVGARTAEQVVENAGAADWRLTQEELQLIDEYVEELGPPEE